MEQLHLNDLKLKKAQLILKIEENIYPALEMKLYQQLGKLEYTICQFQKEIIRETKNLIDK